MRVVAERVGNRVYVRAPFSRKDDCKSVLGARWSPKARAWTYPLEIEVCRMLREAFGDDLEIGPDLHAWAWSARNREEDLNSLNNVQDIDVMSEVFLSKVATQAPTMWRAMSQRPYQPVASQYMASARQCLNGDQPGIGKTIETLGALIEAEVTGNILILAPRTSCTVVWEPEIRKWLADDVRYTITQTAGLTGPKQAEAYERYWDMVESYPDEYMHFLIANAEQVRVKKFTDCPAGTCDGDEDWCPNIDKHKNKSEVKRPFLHKIYWAAIIADETHKWLINTRGKHASQVGYGFTKLRTAEDDSPRWALTGTPLKGKKHNLFGTLNWLRPKTYTSKWRWIEQYFHVTDGEYSREIGEMNDAKKEAFFRSLNGIMIRRTKDELRKINPAWAPPEKRYHDVYVDLAGTQRTHYRKMEKGAEVALPGGLLSATGVLAEMTRLKQFALCDGDMASSGVFMPKMPSAKFEWLLQFLDERGIEVGGDLSDDVQKVVVAMPLTKVLNLWAAELDKRDIRYFLLTGETKDRDRATVTRLFQEEDDVRVILINTELGGVSITLDAADDMVIMQETWVPDEQEQVEDRVHRASNVEHQVDIWYVRAKDTIEEGIAMTNLEKAEGNHVVLDAQRGLRFAAERFGMRQQEEGL